MISLTVHGQPSSKTDSITISRDQQRQCVIWYHENNLKDSIIVSKDSIIVIQDQFIEESDVRIKEIDSKLSQSRQDLKKMKKKRRNAWIVGGFSTILSAILTLIVIK
jgi:hypothetical protein